MDAVYFFRHIPPDTGRIMTEELRYSLRSLASNMSDLGEVHVFGGRAPWFSGLVNHYPVRQGAHKHENTWRIWRHIASAARNGYLPERFILMNDDFFLMRPLAGDVPAYTSGLLSAWIEARRDHSFVRDAANRASQLVASLGVPVEEQLAYELHVPLVVHGPTLAEVWPAMDAATDGGKQARRMIKRSTVANLTPGMNASAVRLERDVKVRLHGDPIPDCEWWSTGDDAFASRNVHRVGVDIRAALSRPSRFEISAVPAGRRPPGAPRLVRSA